MRDFALDLVNNVLADLAMWLGFGLVFWVIVRVAQIRFLRFFGLHTHRALVVYLSNLYRPTDEHPRGGTISAHEFHVGKSLEGLFRSAPFRYPGLVQGLVDEFWIGERPTHRIEISSLSDGPLAYTPMIIVGATQRNSVRRLYLQRGELYLTFAGEEPDPPADPSIKVVEPRVRVNKGQQAGRVIEGNYNWAIVEKVLDREHNTFVFLCAGYRADSSWAATEYLVRHWRALYKKHKTDAFALCLGFPQPDTYMNEYIEPIRLESFPF